MKSVTELCNLINATDVNSEIKMQKVMRYYDAKDKLKYTRDCLHEINNNGDLSYRIYRKAVKYVKNHNKIIEPKDFLKIQTANGVKRKLEVPKFTWSKRKPRSYEKCKEEKSAFAVANEWKTRLVYLIVNGEVKLCRIRLAKASIIDKTLYTTEDGVKIRKISTKMLDEEARETADKMGVWLCRIEV